MTYLVLCTYNRPHYLKECLDSLRRADMQDVNIIIVDDNSTDKAVHEMIADFNAYIVIRKREQSGIKKSLIVGIEMAFKCGAQTVINLDSDGVVRNDFIQRLLETHKQYPDEILTGFNCNTRNRNGSERHKIICQYSDGKWNKKQSVGGINMCFTEDVYNKFIKPALLQPVGNWDHMSCINAGGAKAIQPSVIQHIGIQSSMGHHEPPDIADDFKALSLPDVTLIGADDNAARIWHVAGYSMQNIAFGDVKILSQQAPYNNIPVMGSKTAYSHFMMHELHKHMTTSHMLVIQHDGFVKNYKAWNKEWLQYDYIGAPWEWYRDGMNVGNGGFSLRSKRLMELCGSLPLKTDKEDNGNYAEDHNIARIYRRYLESKGMRFAPIEVARQFSIEGYRANNRYEGQFGFHSFNVKF